MNNQAIICELVGLRGVGKSTLARSVANELRGRNLSCEQFEPLPITGKLIFRLQSSFNLLRAIYIVGKLRPASWQKLYELARRYRGLLNCSSIRFRRGSDVVLYPVGVFQTLYMLSRLTEQKNPSALRQMLLSPLSLPDLAVFIEASEEAVAQRRKLRGEPRDLQYGSQVTEEELKAFNGLKQTAQQLAAEPASGMDYLAVVNETCNLEETATRIADAIVGKHRSMQQSNLIDAVLS